MNPEETIRINTYSEVPYGRHDSATILVHDYNLDAAPYHARREKELLDRIGRAIHLLDRDSVLVDDMGKKVFAYIIKVLDGTE